MNAESQRHPMIGQGFSLVMTLKDPRRLPELMGRLKPERETLDKALGALNYVHFSRFVPLFDPGKLLIVTEFDGSMRDYVMDFAAVLDKQFSLILSYMKDGPRLPVSQYPEEFWDYVRRNTEIYGPGQPVRQPFASYENRTVLDVLGLDAKLASTDKLLPDVAPGLPDLSPMQANIVRGYFSRSLDVPWHAAHLAVCFDRGQGQALLKALTAADATCRVTSMGDWGGGKPNYCLNIGFTHDGLRALGLPVPLLNAFPPAFREGPAKREATVNPGGAAEAPKAWQLGAPEQEVHALLSLYSEDKTTFDGKLYALRGALASARVEVAFDRLQPLDLGGSKVHFGYRDSIANPLIAGLSGDAPPDGGQRPAQLGDFVLGSQLTNSRGGSSLGDLPPALAELASYAAVRIVRQDEAAFGRSLRRAAETLGGTTTDDVAALLMGRKFDGEPRTADSSDGQLGGRDLNHFQYRYDDQPDFDDSKGERCPFGAHIRRMNPRNGAVIGVPALRRVIRRGLPYGPKYEGDSDERERGLFGLFFCSDLESQFEFLLKAWANGDVSSPGVRGSVDWLAAERQKPTSFHVGDRTIEIEPVTQTVGALYLLLPSLPALQRLANPPEAKYGRPQVLPAPTRGDTPAAAPNRYAGRDRFTPLEPAFRIDPYRYYAELRREGPLLPVPKRSGQASLWALSHAAVAEATQNDELFVKPDKAHAIATGAGVTARLGDGLFYMQKARHAQVRPALERAFYEAYGGLDAAIEARAQRLLNAAETSGRIDVVRDYAAPLTTQVFMDMMGLDRSQWETVDRWVRSALDGHHDGADPALRAAGATSAMAMRAYFHALLLGDPGPKVDGVSPPLVEKTAGGQCPLLHGIRALTQGLEGGCPHAGAIEHPLSIDEAMQTALHFALGGYLSTEFLIGTGLYNLLRHPEQIELLRHGDVPWSRAVHEMLRYDAPFQMADRVAAKDCQLAGVDVKAGSLVVLVYGSANHDEVYGPTAEAFDIKRKPQQQHFGFGPAARDCIGKAMGARVAEIGLRVLVERWPKLGARTRFQAGDWVADPYYRSLKSLQLLLDP